MTRKQLEELLDVWQARLALDHVDIKLDFDTAANTTAHATVDKHPIYDRAIITFEPEWEGWEDEFAEYIIVHELLHVLHADVYSAVDTIDGMLGAPAEALFHGRFTFEVEQFIDRMARALVLIANDNI